MKTQKIEAKQRENLGKKDTKKLREQGLVPGVLYGKNEVVHLQIASTELKPFIYTPNVFLVDLEVEDKTFKAMVQDVQWHPVEEQIMHVDFLKVEDDKPVKIGVPVQIIGLAKGIKAGGKLKMNMRKLQVKALADDLPDAIEIDVSSLGIGDSIKVAELQREKLEFLDNKSNLIVGVISTRAAKSSSPLPEDEEEAEGGTEESSEPAATE
ncbi:MAG: 50S ribosomal protein L25/general stress protein Ctc [Mariniphaga sp.]|nr:50S ribosomal protein L25/general stress protein Ctc [Mariniphaga sp.]MDD4226718.1 50S ribosomal protein L25/general stress protein Ctc [Mariniphaga sp.]